MTIEEKLQALRVKWTKHPELREVIERQVKALKYSQQPYKIKSDAKHEEFVQEVLNNLI